MKFVGTRALCLAMGLGLMGWTGSLHAAGVERADLLPQPARWTDLPGDVRGVAIDHTGRAWFELTGDVPEDQLKRQVEAAVTLKAPWIRGAYLLLVDAKNRVWLLPNVGQSKILCYDPAGHQWIEHPLWQDPKVPQDPRDLYPHGFRTEVYEAKNGVLYFGGRRGVYTCAGDDWNYQPFYEMNAQQNLYSTDIRAFNPILFAESDDGLVFAWSPWNLLGWSGTVGAWVHDSHQWTQILTDVGDEKNRGRLKSVAPLGGGKVLVCPDAPETAHPFIFQATSPAAIDQKQLAADIQRLSDDNFDLREQATRRLAGLGTGAMSALQTAAKNITDPEALARLQAILHALGHPDQGAPIDGRLFNLAGALSSGYHDPQESVVLWGLEGPQIKNTIYQKGSLFLLTPQARLKPLSSDSVGIFQATSLATHDHKIFIGSKGGGISLFKDNQLTRITTSTESAYFNLVAEDGAGRIYVVDAPTEGGGLRPAGGIAGTHWAVLDLTQPDTRLSLPVTAFPARRGAGMAMLDSTGRLWSTLAGPDHAFLSVFDDGKWIDARLPQDAQPVDSLRSAQPLGEGALVAQTQDRAAQPGRGLLLDHGQWSVYPTVFDLVERQFGRLQKIVINNVARNDAVLLRQDRAGNIWVVDWDDVRVYNGQTWTHMADTPDKPPIKRVTRILPVENAAKMLVVGVDDMAVAQITGGQMRLTRFPHQNLDTNVAASGNGDGLFIDSQDRSWVPTNHDATLFFDATGRHELPGIRYPRLEDSAGRIWFLDKWKSRITMLLRDGRTVDFPDDSLFDKSSMAEDRPDSFWITTSTGLAHVLLDGSTPAPALRRVANYSANLPRAAAQGLWMDGQSNLWTITAENANNTLWRIAIK